MTWEEYYKIIKARWECVNKERIEEIREYNHFKEELRKLVGGDNGR